jgi:LysR family hydrogen peroxide-inducible transcriptional activator
MSFAPHAASLRQLQYAVAVADARSFRRAAEQCGVSQPSLSAQLSQLEGALGVRLFERDRRRVLLTSAGEDLIARARRVLVDADDLVDAARRLGDPLAGTLAIGVIPTVSPYLLPAASPAIRRAHPKLTIRWLEDKTEILARDLHGGRLDAALLALEADLGGPLQREVIARDPFVLVTPRAHPLASRSRAASLSELRGAHLLLLDDGHCLRDQALAVCVGARTEELAFRATSLPTLAQMVSAGAGVTLLPRMSVATESRRAHIAVRALADERAFRTLALVWRPTSPSGPALRKLAATIRASYEKTIPSP